MSILALARKWLLPRVTPLTDLEIVEEADFRKRAIALWLEYHENALWAQRKLESGLRLTPEALDYMENEVNARKLAAASRDANLKEIDHDHPVPAATSPLEGGEPDRLDAGNGGGGAERPQETGGGLDSGEPKGSQDAGPER